VPERHTNGLPGILFSGVVLLLGLSSLWIAYAASNEAEPVAAVAPIIPPAVKGEQCVADTDLMRTDHMKFLNHQRDSTVIDGVRGEPFSLVACVDCHAQTTAEGKPVRIDAEGQFCESCHSYAAVKIDCFTCHAAVPEQEELIGLQQNRKFMKDENNLSAHPETVGTGNNVGWISLRIHRWRYSVVDAQAYPPYENHIFSSFVDEH